MCCYYCQAFVRDRDEDSGPLDFSRIVDEARETKGHCTLFPTWIPVTGLHFCQQFHQQNDGYWKGDEGRTSITGQFWIRMHEAVRERDQQRELRIAAEKKLKELRAKTRQKNGHANV